MKPFENFTCMGFKRFLAITIFFMLLFGCESIRTQDLFHLEIESKSNEGKDLVMVLDEIERHDKFSIIKVHRTSGASVPSVMVIVRGCYEIAKIRNEKYFANLKEWTDEQGNWMYKIGFTSDRNINPKEYFGDEIDEEKLIELLYMSVDDLKQLMEQE